MSSLLLLSGGIDSASILYWKKPKVALTIDYGQICAKAEIQASKALCKYLNISHKVLSIDCRSLGSGVLVDKRSLKIAPDIEWWPFRNQFLITLAAMFAMANQLDLIYFGAVKSDLRYIDTSTTFLNTMNEVIQMQEGSIRIVYPAINLTSVQLIRNSQIPMELLAWTHSCNSSNLSCGECESCTKHLSIFNEFNFNI